MKSPPAYLMFWMVESRVLMQMCCDMVGVERFEGWMVGVGWVDQGG